MKGRKIDVKKRDTIDKIFKRSKNRGQFEVEIQNKVGIAKSTATVYWYNLCKENGRVVPEKRGRKPVPKVQLDEKTLLTARNYVETQIHQAKASKRSTVAFRHILDLIS